MEEHGLHCACFGPLTTALANEERRAQLLIEDCAKLRAEVVDWKTQYGCLKIQEEAALKERNSAILQLGEAKKLLSEALPLIGLDPTYEESKIIDKWELRAKTLVADKPKC